VAIHPIFMLTGVHSAAGRNQSKEIAMKKTWLAALALGAALLCAASACTPPDDAPPPKKGGPPPPPPRFELGRVLPPHFRDELDLTEVQEAELDELEQEVRQRVLKLLSPEQRTRLHELRRRRPGPPPGPPRDEPRRAVNPW
jgi:hypothetical protein